MIIIIICIILFILSFPQSDSWHKRTDINNKERYDALYDYKSDTWTKEIKKAHKLILEGICIVIQRWGSLALIIIMLFTKYL